MRAIYRLQRLKDRLFTRMPPVAAGTRRDSADDSAVWAFLRSLRYTRECLRGEGYDIGAFTYGTPRVFGQAPGRKLKIGKFCSIAQEVTIALGGEHAVARASTYPFPIFPRDWPEAGFLLPDELYAFSKGDVVIGNDVWIGYGATILSGVTIGDGVIIGARAVVTKHVEPYAIVAGNPARLLRKRFDDPTISRLLEIRWWDWPIGKIKANMTAIVDTDIARILAVDEAGESRT
jgi:acetyltransferase-like isoleucine patch superfamily enzyme